MIRAGAAVIALLIVVLVVSNWWEEYRAAMRTGNGTESTATVEPGVESEEETATEDAETEEKPPATPSAPESGEAGTGKTVVVVVDGLNFRVAPERDAKLIRGLPAGTKLVHLETKDDWHKVKDANGVVGYVSASTQYSRLED
jgi:hypothetical protein